MPLRSLAAFGLGASLFGCIMTAPLQAQDERPAAEILRGDGEFLNRDTGARDGPGDQLPGGPLTVRLVDVEVAVVVQEIIGEALGMDYTIAADVQGQISLRMTGLTSREAVLQQLRIALNSINVAMIDRGDFIAVVRGGAGGQGGAVAVITAGEPVSPGANIVAIQLTAAQPSAVSSLLTALVDGAQLRLVDDTRGLIVLAGEPTVLSAASETALLLDVDILAQLSTGIFPLLHAEAGAVASDLRQLMRTTSDALEFVPVERLDLLVVFANTPRALERARMWVSRLDRPPSRPASGGQRVYTVRHTDPAELVDAIVSFFGEGGRESGAANGAGGSRMIAAGVRVGAAPNQNIILLEGEDTDITRVWSILEMLDQPRAQVRIEAAIAEVTLSETNRFGVDWSAIEDNRLALDWNSSDTGVIGSRFPGFSAVYINADLEVTLNALASQSELEIISRPSLVTLHNQQAELQVGDQVPVIVQSAVSIDSPDAPLVNQTAYRDTGILLTVLPQIREGGLVEIDISQEVSGVQQTTTSGIDSPTITRRRIASSLLVPSGETVALGGLISTRRTDAQSGVPGLRRIPVLGRAFRSDTQIEDRTELVILLTPTIISSPANLDDGTLALPAALERLRRRIDSQ